ncbi:MAG: GNAT family N-acetyltransferase [Pseudonocardia sp.]|nr:GNAT family N-acetyltransferase [Pseudonocardia sp.]
MESALVTERLLVRSWTLSDTEDALATYGVGDVTGWLTPATDRVGDAAAMRSVLAAWMEAQANLVPPRGRWAIERRADGVVVGGLAIRLLPPYEQDLEISFQLRPDAWGNGYATEAAAALIGWAFTHDEAEELFAVALPDNIAAIATAHRLGMSWVGETDKYYDRTLQVYRIRPGDLAVDPMIELPDTDT